jgi:hypothetical protein
MTDKYNQYYARIRLTGEVELTINAANIEEARGIASTIVDSEVYLSPNLFRRSQVHPDVLGYVSGKVEAVEELVPYDGGEMLLGRGAYETRIKQGKPRKY